MLPGLLLLLEPLVLLLFLLSVVQVSKLWRDSVGGLQGLWLRQASRVGCNTGLGEETGETDWRLECVAGLRSAY